jgi:hypothetical protein
MPLQKRTFLALDQDTEDRRLQQGSYRYALNVRSGSSDNDNVPKETHL